MGIMDWFRKKKKKPKPKQSRMSVANPYTNPEYIDPYNTGIKFRNPNYNPPNGSSGGSSGGFTPAQSIMPPEQKMTRIQQPTTPLPTPATPQPQQQQQPQQNISQMNMQQYREDLDRRYLEAVQSNNQEEIRNLEVEQREWERQSGQNIEANPTQKAAFYGAAGTGAAMAGAAGIAIGGGAIASAAGGELVRRSGVKVLSKLQQASSRINKPGFISKLTSKADLSAYGLPGQTARFASRVTMPSAVKALKYIGGYTVAYLLTAGFSSQEITDISDRVTVARDDVQMPEYQEELDRIQEFGENHQWVANIPVPGLNQILTAFTVKGPALHDLNKAIADDNKAVTAFKKKFEKQYKAEDYTQEDLDLYLKIEPYGWVKDAEDDKLESGGYSPKEKIAFENEYRATINDWLQVPNLNNVQSLYEKLSADKEFQQYITDNWDSQLADDWEYILKLQQRLMNQEAYGGGSGGGGSTEAQNLMNARQQAVQNIANKEERERYETESSLLFGLLETPAGYEPDTEMQKIISRVNEGSASSEDLALYLYGVPYAQLTEPMQQVVDTWNQ